MLLLKSDLSVLDSDVQIGITLDITMRYGP